MLMKLLKIHEKDNVAVALDDLKAGQVVKLTGCEAVVLAEEVSAGHKVALRDIEQNEKIIKYGFPIGYAVVPVRAGQWVHTMNVKTNLGEILAYDYQPQFSEVVRKIHGDTFWGYQRPDGRVGIRNEIWVIPTVSCVNRIAELIARKASEELQGFANLDGVFEFKHPYGCSQMGEDQLTTQRILADLVHHPNAAAVLVLGLGCENNNIEQLQKVIGPFDPDRVKFLVAQEVEDEIGTGIELIRQLAKHAVQYQRGEYPAAKLVVGLKCGGSDGLSGITANPLVGVFSDILVSEGGTSVLTEVPEMFGAETLLMNRAKDRQVFEKIVKMINSFKDYFNEYNQPIYENPSPGNKQGGISTLEDKSLGCTQKGGLSPVVDVLAYAERIQQPGLNLLTAPGNDMVACTALAAAGCQLILFTTGRGTPLGTCVPTIKLSTNSGLFARKPAWMDFDAGVLLDNVDMEQLAERLWTYVLEIASGRRTKAENLGFREIAIFKNGVTL